MVINDVESFSRLCCVICLIFLLHMVLISYIIWALLIDIVLIIEKLELDRGTYLIKHKVFFLGKKIF